MLTKEKQKELNIREEEDQKKIVELKVQIAKQKEHIENDIKRLFDLEQQYNKQLNNSSPGADTQGRQATEQREENKSLNKLDESVNPIGTLTSLQGKAESTKPLKPKTASGSSKPRAVSKPRKPKDPTKPGSKPAQNIEEKPVKSSPAAK